MAEISPLPPSAEMMSAASGISVAPAAGAVDGGFSGLLAQRLRPSADTPQNTRPADGRAPLAATDGLAKTTNTRSAQGQASPQPGKALPLDDVVTDRFAEALEPAPTVAVPADVLMTTPATDLALLSLSSAEPSALTSGLLSEAVAENPELAVLNSPAETVAAVIPVASAAIQQTTDVSAVLPREAMNAFSSAQPLPQERLLSQAALQMAKLENEQAASPRVAMPQLAASLGLNANGEPATAPRGAATTLSAEQMLRNGVGSATGSAVGIPNQALLGESLSRQFQQQIDRMLTASRGSISGVAGLDAGLLKTAPDSVTGAIYDASMNMALPGMESRAATVTAALSGVTVPVSTGVGQPGWSADLGQRMVWLANQEIREAQIQLNPRHLGPIDVRIVYSDSQQLSVHFNAQNPAARDALDAALPRLREMFDQQGLNLANANVFDGNASQQFFSEQRQGAENSAQGMGNAFADAEITDDELLSQRNPSIPIGHGMLDTFA